MNNIVVVLECYGSSIPEIYSKQFVHIARLFAAKLLYFVSSP
jgi:hypothetical protein